ncbi:MAG: 30S ribosomal protein S16 [Atribacterota bacterium]
MAVKMRLTRVGRAHVPHYRIVAVDSEEARDGKPIEILGNYSPIMNPPVWALKWDRIEYWLSQGVKPSDKVRNILRKVRREVISQ